MEKINTDYNRFQKLSTCCRREIVLKVTLCAMLLDTDFVALKIGFENRLVYYHL